LPIVLQNGRTQAHPPASYGLLKRFCPSSMLLLELQRNEIDMY
jgi:hypothetical protein